MTPTNNIESDIIELKFQGNNIRPDLMSNRDIAEMLIAFDNAIMPIFKDQNPEISSPLPLITFKDIGYKSISFRNIIREHQGKVKQAFTTLILSVSTQSVDGIPKQSQNAISKIVSFTNRHNCDASFGYSNNGVFVPLTGIHSFEKDTFKKFKEDKTYFGRLVKLDAESMYVHFRLINGQTLKSKINQEQVEEYRILIGEDVKIYGEATLSGRTLKRTSFNVKDINPRASMTINEAIESLREVFN